ncbi:MAG: hypothetical protein KJO31_07825 [Gammaproteobacteria bacterium]|nr:hypothetical protein [Gammaproteobacteria bacterium]
MADKMKDDEDLKLESLFASRPIADNGFSDRVLKRVRRRIWIRRLSLPVAFAVGGSIAVKPLTELLTALFSFATSLPSAVGLSADLIPSSLIPTGSTIMLGLMAALVFVMVGKMLED